MQNNRFLYISFFLLLFMVTWSINVYAQPSNDDCSNATPIAVGINNSQSPTNGTNIGASDSGVFHTCALYIGGDVWFSFVAPPLGAVTIETSADGSGTILDTGLAVYNDCGGLIAQGCDDDGGLNAFSRLDVTGLIAGNTYYVATWEFGNNIFGTFNICAWDPSAIPANDDCFDAIPLAVGTISCESSIAVTNSNATDSGVAHTCANYLGGDVWYSFVAPPLGAVAVVTSDDGSGTIGDTGLAVYDDCGGLVTQGCDDFGGPNSFSRLDVTGLIAGNTYFVAVWEDGNNVEGTFNICIYIINPPSNDECVNAIPLSINLNECLTPTNASNVGATDSGIPHTCAQYIGGDVWFSFIAPSTGDVTIETSTDGTGTINDTGIAVYDDCGGLVSQGCDNKSGLGKFSRLDLTGLIVGNTYYVAAWEFGNDNVGTFNICAWSLSFCPDDYADGMNGSSQAALLGLVDLNSDYETPGAIISKQVLGMMNSLIGVDYDSGVEIVLLPGFEVNLGVQFDAFIDTMNCNDGEGGNQSPPTN